MSHGPVTITKATWDLRPKTKFIHIEGSAFAKSYSANIIIDRSTSPPFNDKILLLEASIENDDGPMKVQPIPFHFSDVTNGDEPWTHVEIVCGEETATFPITKLTY